MRSPVFSRSCLSPPLPAAYRDESARHESNDRRGFRFQRGAEWNGGEERKRRERDPPRIRDPRMFPQSCARALFCRFVSGVAGTILMRGNDLPGFAAPGENLIIEKVELCSARWKIAAVIVLGIRYRSFERLSRDASRERCDCEIFDLWWSSICEDLFVIFEVSLMAIQFLYRSDNEFYHGCRSFSFFRFRWKNRESILERSFEISFIALINSFLNTLVDNCDLGKIPTNL